MSQTIYCKNGTRCRIPTNIEMYGCVLHWTVHTCNLYYVSIITSITGEHNNGSKTINTPHTHNMKHDYIPNIQHCSRTIYNMAQNSFVTEIKMQTLFVFFNLHRVRRLPIWICGYHGRTHTQERRARSSNGKEGFFLVS